MSFLNLNKMNLNNTDFTDDNNYDYETYRILIDSSVDNNSVTDKGNYTVTFTPLTTTTNQLLINIGTLKDVVAVRLLGYSFPNSVTGTLYNILSIDELKDNRIYSNVNEVDGAFEILFSDNSNTSTTYSNPKTEPTQYHYYNPAISKLSKLTIKIDSYKESDSSIASNTSDHVLYLEIQTRQPNKQLFF
jgi:hypothetical protein